ncbi:MAG: M3 family metallopeptidase, partial [Chrysiogenetes bacterium]|nr:M3 family metallopeptidase [Chrysiogenetes bacterium]
MSTSDNPLLNLSFEIPFDRIEAAHVEPGIDALLKRARVKLEAVKTVSSPRTFENTMLAFEAITHDLHEAMSVISNIESLATTPEFREAYNAVQQPVSEFYSSIVLDEDLWKALRDYSETDEAKALTGIRKRYLQKTIADFRREGADLPPEKKKELASIDVELSKLTTKFSQNVLDATVDYEIYVTDEAKLAGLPASAIEAARADAESRDKAGWRFTLQAPSFIPLMTYIDDAEIRRRVWTAYNTRATGGETDNSGLIKQIRELREKRARMLGFANFADLVLDDRMAREGAAAKKFTEELREKSEEAFRSENEDLRAFRKEIEGQDAPDLNPWDVGYYAEKQRKALYAFDEEEVRPYFPMENVLKGMFEIVNRLYGIQVVPTEKLPTWHKDVRTYDILEEDGTHIASFYADLFPRDNKRGGAWMTDLLTGGPAGKGFIPHLGGINGNMMPPVGGKPALLTHRDVETLFHEFGHLLHHALSRVELRSLSGTNVAWDFVELPSQIMENWCWEKEALDLFARHYETGDAIPDDLFEKMLRARNFRSANAMMRQLGFATVDLKIHTEYDPEQHGDVLPYARDVLAEFATTALPDDYAMICGFTHLFAGPVAYAAGYYSYKWAEVLDADAFTRFKAEGIFNREVGRAFRESVLANGDAEDPMDLYKKFMGREPDLSALLERSGLLD